jgi:hypothetical protein
MQVHEQTLADLSLGTAGPKHTADNAARTRQQVQQLLNAAGCLLNSNAVLGEPQRGLPCSSLPLAGQVAARRIQGHPQLWVCGGIAPYRVGVRPNLSKLQPNQSYTALCTAWYLSQI